MTVVTVLAGGKILARQVGDAVNIDAADTEKAINVTVKELRKVEFAIGIHLDMSPGVASTESIGSPVGTKITDNVVGFTVSDIETAAGSTITPTVDVVGYA